MVLAGMHAPCAYSARRCVLSESNLWDEYKMRVPKEPEMVLKHTVCRQAALSLSLELGSYTSFARTLHLQLRKRAAARANRER